MEPNSIERRDRRRRWRDGLATLTTIAILYGWLAPEAGAWRIVAIAIAGAWLVTLAGFTLIWLADKRAGDTSAILDARLVFALGAATALGLGHLVETASGDTSLATVVIVALLIPALVAYVFVAARTPNDE